MEQYRSRISKLQTPFSSFLVLITVSIYQYELFYLSNKKYYRYQVSAVVIYLVGLRPVFRRGLTELGVLPTTLLPPADTGWLPPLGVLVLYLLRLTAVGELDLVLLFGERLLYPVLYSRDSSNRRVSSSRTAGSYAVSRDTRTRDSPS